MRGLVAVAIAADLALWSAVSFVIVAIHVIGIVFLLLVPRLLTADAPTATEDHSNGTQGTQQARTGE